jgi:hypothetical protein
MSTASHAPKSPRRTRRLAGRTATIAATVAALTVGGIAAANWTISGAGSGGAEATTVTNLVVSVSADGDLFPGATVDGNLTVTNSNPFPVRITAVTFSGDVTVATPAGTCTPANSEVTFTTKTGLTLDVAANATSEELVGALVDAIEMGSGADNDCQGRVFSREFTVTAEIAP